MDLTVDATCPHCGEPLELAIDPTGGADQVYIEDCAVCCRPIRVNVTFDREGHAGIELAPSA